MTSVVQPLIQPDLAAIAAHLQALFSPVLDDGQGGLIEIRHGPIDPTLKRAAINHNAWFRLDQIDAAAAYAADCNARGHNVYVGVNPRKPDTDQSGHGADVDVALATIPRITRRGVDQVTFTRRRFQHANEAAGLELLPGAHPQVQRGGVVL